MKGREYNQSKTVGKGLYGASHQSIVRSLLKGAEEKEEENRGQI